MTTDTTLANTYNLKIEGSNSYTATWITIKVYVMTSACSSNTIYKNEITTPQKYLIGASAIILAFSPWTSSIAGCGVFTYTATFSDGSALNSNLITFYPTT